MFVSSLYANLHILQGTGPFFGCIISSLLIWKHNKKLNTIFLLNSKVFDSHISDLQDHLFALRTKYYVVHIPIHCLRSLPKYQCNHLGYLPYLIYSTWLAHRSDIAVNGTSQLLRRATFTMIKVKANINDWLSWPFVLISHCTKL